MIGNPTAMIPRLARDSIKIRPAIDLLEDWQAGRLEEM